MTIPHDCKTSHIRPEAEPNSESEIELENKPHTPEADYMSPECGNVVNRTAQTRVGTVANILRSSNIQQQESEDLKGRIAPPFCNNSGAYSTFIEGLGGQDHTDFADTSDTGIQPGVWEAKEKLTNEDARHGISKKILLRGQDSHDSDPEAAEIICVTLGNKKEENPRPSAEIVYEEDLRSCWRGMEDSGICTESQFKTISAAIYVVAVVISMVLNSPLLLFGSRLLEIPAAAELAVAAVLCGICIVSVIWLTSYILKQRNNSLCRCRGRLFTIYVLVASVCLVLAYLALYAEELGLEHYEWGQAILMVIIHLGLSQLMVACTARQRIVYVLFVKHRYVVISTSEYVRTIAVLQLPCIITVPALFIIHRSVDEEVYCAISAAVIVCSVGLYMAYLVYYTYKCRNVSLSFSDWRVFARFCISIVVVSCVILMLGIVSMHDYHESHRPGLLLFCLLVAVEVFFVDLFLLIAYIVAKGYTTDTLLDPKHTFSGTQRTSTGGIIEASILASHGSNSMVLPISSDNVRTARRNSIRARNVTHACELLGLEDLNNSVFTSALEAALSANDRLADVRERSEQRGDCSLDMQHNGCTEAEKLDQSTSNLEARDGSVRRLEGQIQKKDSNALSPKGSETSNSMNTVIETSEVPEVRTLRSSKSKGKKDHLRSSVKNKQSTGRDSATTSSRERNKDVLLSLGLLDPRPD